MGKGKKAKGNTQNQPNAPEDPKTPSEPQQQSTTPKKGKQGTTPTKPQHSSDTAQTVESAQKVESAKQTPPTATPTPTSEETATKIDRTKGDDDTNSKNSDEENSNNTDNNNNDDNSNDNSNDNDNTTTQPRLTEDELADFERSQRKRGILYLGRIPPHVGPEQIRELLGKYGKLDRIYLVPEDESVRRNRKRMGGSKKVNYVEGFVEFVDKRVAQLVSRCLNNQPMGGPRRAFYRHDLWNLKYLNKVKWSHLQELLTVDRAVKNQKYDAERRQAAKEAEFYVARVNQAQEIAKRPASKKPTHSSKKNTTTTTETTTTPTTANTDISKIRRSFAQRSAVVDPADPNTPANLNVEILRQILPAKEGGVLKKGEKGEKGGKRKREGGGEGEQSKRQKAV